MAVPVLRANRCLNYGTRTLSGELVYIPYRVIFGDRAAWIVMGGMTFTLTFLRTCLDWRGLGIDEIDGTEFVSLWVFRTPSLCWTSLT